MPCIDILADRDAKNEKARYVSQLEDKLQFLEAALCGALKITGLQQIDYKEAGIDKRELQRWWYNHKRRDKRRLANLAERLHTHD